MQKFFLLIFLLLINLNARVPITPGAHKGVPLYKNNWTVDIYIPKAYATKPNKKFPVLYIFGPDGKPGFQGLEKWAEEREFLLVSANDSQYNNNTSHSQDPFRSIRLRDAIKNTIKKLRSHQYLQFITTLGEASKAGLNFASHSESPQVAGILFQRKIIISLVKHRSTTLLYGAADVDKRYQSPESYIRQTQLKGFHVKGKGVATDSKWMPTDECIKMLNHMYDYQRFYNKYLTPQEREKAWASFALKHSSILKEEHSSERTTALYELLSTHQILEQKFGKKLLRYWGRAIIKDLKSLKKKPKASCKLIINNDHYLKLLKGKTKKKYLMLAKATTTHPKNLKDFEALNRFKYLLQSERKNAKKAEKIKFNSYNFQERRKAHHVENAKKHIHKYRALTRNYPKAYINKKVKEHIWLLEEKYSL